MKLTGNTLLITGGGSGIGRGLAEAFQRLGNTVIIAGRRQSALDEVTRVNPGMASLPLDIDDPQDIQRFARDLLARHPKLNTVIHSAGIMKSEDILKQGTDTSIAEATITTNLLGPLRLNGALLEHLVRQPSAAIMTVSSGLAFVPMFPTPTYCASKAAVHSYTQSLRYQLKETNVRVVELIPPYVRTELMGQRQANDPAAMPLDAFITEVIQILQANPKTEEICVERVKGLRFAERSGTYDTFYNDFNKAMAHHR